MFSTTSPSVIATSVINHPALATRQAADRNGAAARPATANPLGREQILQATHACFAECGYDGTTIRAIAARLGCSVGSIYRYFADKRELLLACAAAVFEPLLEATRQGEVDAAAAFRRYVHLAAEHDELYRLLFWLSAAGGSPRVPDVVQKLLDAWQGDLPDAAEHWARAHGLLMLAVPPTRIVADLPEAAPLATGALAVAEAAAEDEADDEVDVTLL